MYKRTCSMPSSDNAQPPTARLPRACVLSVGVSRLPNGSRPVPALGGFSRSHDERNSEANTIRRIIRINLHSRQPSSIHVSAAVGLRAGRRGLSSRSADCSNDWSQEMPSRPATERALSPSPGSRGAHGADFAVAFTQHRGDVPKLLLPAQALLLGAGTPVHPSRPVLFQLAQTRVSFNRRMFGAGTALDPSGPVVFQLAQMGVSLSQRKFGAGTALNPSGPVVFQFAQVCVVLSQASVLLSQASVLLRQARILLSQ